MFDTTNWIFHGKPVIMVNKFHPFLEGMEFSKKLVGYLFEFYGISTFVGYLMPNPFLYN